MSLTEGAGLSRCRSLLCGARRPDSPILEPLVHGGGHPNVRQSLWASTCVALPEMLSPASLRSAARLMWATCAVQDFTDLQSWMLRNRIVFTGTRIDEQVGSEYAKVRMSAFMSEFSLRIP